MKSFASAKNGVSTVWLISNVATLNTLIDLIIMDLRSHAGQTSAIDVQQNLGLYGKES